MDCPSDLVKVMQPETEQVAISVVDLLRDAGVFAVLYPYPRSYVEILFGEAAQPAWGEILVRRAQAEKADELIGGFLGTLGLLAPAEHEGIHENNLEGED